MKKYIRPVLWMLTINIIASFITLLLTFMSIFNHYSSSTITLICIGIDILLYFIAGYFSPKSYKSLNKIDVIKTFVFYIVLLSILYFITFTYIPVISSISTFLTYFLFINLSFFSYTLQAELFSIISFLIILFFILMYIISFFIGYSIRKKCY